MKKLLAMIILLVAGIVGMNAQTSGNAAIDEVTSIQRIMLQASEYVLACENDLQLEIVHLQFDLIIGNEWKYTYRTLSNYWTYVLYAEGEKGMVKDFDIKILKEDQYGDWNEVTSDTKGDFGGMVAVTPLISTRYAIGIKAAAYEEGLSGGHYFLIVAHKKPAQ